MGPLKRPRIKYIGQLARWQILALIPLFFRFPIPQVCPPLELTPLNEATDPDDMSMIEAVVFISVMLSENTCQQSWSWSFWFEENLFHQSLDCVQASLYSLISSPVRISIVDSTIHHNHHLVLYFATTVIFNREDQNHHQFYNFLRACQQTWGPASIVEPDTIHIPHQVAMNGTFQQYWHLSLPPVKCFTR